MVFKFHYRRKLQTQMKDLEEQLSSTQTKYSSLEKTKSRIAGELEDVMLDLEKEKNATAAWEKKKKAIDQQINEWKAKFEAAQQELDASKAESRQYSTEVIISLPLPFPSLPPSFSLPLPPSLPPSLSLSLSLFLSLSLSFIW